MFWNCYDVTQRYQKDLMNTGSMARGWGILGGRLKDVSDIQWRDFTNNLFILIGGMGAYILGSRAIRMYISRRRAAPLLRYYFTLNVIVVAVLHGSRTLFMFAILCGHYALCRLVSRYRFAVAASWLYTIAILFLNEYYRGYNFEDVFGASFAWLDTYRGLYRWNVTFNMSTLRMISFGSDWHEAIFHPEKVESERGKHRDCDDCIECQGSCYSLRVNTPRSPSEYSFINYIAFVLYFPTYFAGPITTFNGWVSYAEETQTTYGIKYVLFYALRLLNIYVLLELSLHFAYINAIRGIRDVVFSTLTPMQLGSIGFFTLNFLWMKFAFIWRFCRLMAMLDGVEVPENMLRCWGNNFSVTGFWKSWHSSYNKWIVRYMYVPLGGSKYKGFNVWPIFTFVALWHDITLQLFQWAWIMSLFFLPEFLGEFIMSKTPLKFMKRAWYYRHVRAMAGAVNIILLMIANLVGYGVGTSKTTSGITGIFSMHGATFAFGAFSFLFTVSQIMIKRREIEAAQAAERHQRLHQQPRDRISHI
jgi:D-alanyl-lipoteichoic acid acyltransferase DltB (MBOAT superfamily)